MDAATPTPEPTEDSSDENPLDLSVDDGTATLSLERVDSPPKLSAEPDPAAAAASPTPPPVPDEPEESPGEIDLDKLSAFADTVARTHGIGGLRQLERELRENFPATTNLDKATELIRERAASVDVVPKSFDLPPEFIGGYEEAILGASMVLRQSENNPELALALATGPLARTVERFERAGLSPMQLVDLVVHLFAGEAVFRNGSTPPANPGFIGFVSRLVALLDQDHDSPADSLFTTRVNLVTWYAQAEDRQCLRHAARLGLDALRHVVEGGSLEPAAARVLQQLANNLAGWLPELSRVASRTETLPKNFGKHLNALHALATIAHLIEESSPKSAEVLEPITSMGLRIDEKLAGPAVQALMFMTNIPVAWYWLCDLFDEGQVGGSIAGKLEPGWYRSSVLTMLSAVMRSRFSRDRDIRNVPASLFNLGVQVIRIGKSEGTEASLPLRILTNGFGLWWALMKGKSLRHSVDEMSAGDCLVNLFGALNEWSNNKRVGSPDLPSGLRTVVDVLHPLMNKEDQYRVGNSYKQIYEEDVRSAPRAGSEELARTVTAVLTMFLDGLEGNQGESPDVLHEHLKQDKDFCRHLLGALAGAFAHIDRAAGKSRIGDAVMGWLAVAEALATRALNCDLKPVTALIPVTLDGWYVEEIKDDVRVPLPEKDAPYLSRTLRDVALMREVFGLG
ncbi:MAG: hypothetical protein IPJ99_19595 [Betaproteobacteria bacterium]|nr:hypothetical protein [Betaproteobacteria bacterium]MBK8918047.1 hypothetical protein [Betaproteobacteria bacterium]MBP6907311.1 hypothetical protein [Azonexus sp.]